MRLCGRRVGFHVNTHENIAQFAVILPVAGIYSVELAISYDNIVDAVSFAPNIERVSCVTFLGSRFVVEESAILYGYVFAQY